MSPDNAAHLRPAWVEIDLDAFAPTRPWPGGWQVGRSSMRYARATATVRGAAEIAGAALEGGADALAVGNPAEALALRRHGLGCPILLYACSLPEDAAASPP